MTVAEIKTPLVRSRFVPSPEAWQFRISVVTADVPSLLRRSPRWPGYSLTETVQAKTVGAKYHSSTRKWCVLA